MKKVKTLNIAKCIVKTGVTIVISGIVGIGLLVEAVNAKSKK